MQQLSVQIALLKRTLQRSLRDRILDLASSIAFYASFGIFPLLLLVVAGATFALDSEQVQSQLLRLVEETFPASSDLVQESVRAVI